jgi:uncharacterized membrane protein YeaQ/YmgE (transglycosylase-associated protein family)
VQVVTRPAKDVFATFLCIIEEFGNQQKGTVMAAIMGWIMVGLVAGVLAKLLMPGRDPGGLVVTVLLGVAGALLAGYLGQVLNVYQPGQAAGWVGATVGAFILLGLYRIVMARRS